MAGATGLEPATSGVTGRRSNQLSYAPDGQFGGTKEAPKSGVCRAAPKGCQAKPEAGNLARSGSVAFGSLWQGKPMGTAKDYGEAERLQKWMASLEANLEGATGKSLAEWIKIAKKCPPGPYMAQLKWFKDNHGLGQGRAGLILERTFGKEAVGEAEPEQLLDELFARSFAAQRLLYDPIEAYARTLDGVTVAPRKGYVALYRKKQFVAIKPGREGLLVGLAMKSYPKSARLKPVKNLGGGDRTKFAVIVTSSKEIDASLKALIKAAWAEN